MSKFLTPKIVNDTSIKLANDLVRCKTPITLPINVDVRAPENIDSYKPEMERATRAPRLPNQGNLCYFNAVIKMLANQFSMEQLKSSLDEGGGTKSGDAEAAEKQPLKEKLIK